MEASTNVSVQRSKLQALSQVKMGSNNYLLYPGGGILFKFSESDNSITRIDRSFAHRNQYSGYFNIWDKDFSFNW